MSFRNIQKNWLSNLSVLNSPEIASSAVPVFNDSTYVRNPSWPALPVLLNTEEKFVGLYAVYPNSSYIAFTATTSAGAQYTVNWGDGTSQNVNNNTQVNYLYDYNDPDLDGTNAPVTFDATTNTVNRNNHGYTNGMLISFADVVTTTGITKGRSYYVINATTNTFQLSLTEGGSPIALLINGTGVILPYKIATVTITPVSGNLVALNLYVKHNATNLQNGYSTGWLDISFSMTTNTTGIAIGNSGTNVRHSYLEQIKILKRGTQASFANLCYNLIDLQAIDITNSGSNITSTNSMFFNCYNIKSASLNFNTSTVTDMTSMFQGCLNLRSISGINCAACTNTTNMFNGCSSLNTVSLSNVGAITNATSMFQGCTSLIQLDNFTFTNLQNATSMFQSCAALQKIPQLITPNLTNTTSMFQSCTALTDVTTFDTTKVTNMTNMFNTCNSLTVAPYLNTSNVTTMVGTFQSCPSLVEIPLYNTINVTNTNNLFASCTSLTSIPLLNMSNVSNVLTMFNACSSLVEVPPLNFEKLTSATNLFSNCFSLEKIGNINISNVTDATGMFAGCNSLVEIPLLNTSKITNATSMFSSCSNLKTIPLLDFSNLTNGSTMFNSCRSLVEIPLLNFSKLTTGSSMFQLCASLKTIPILNLSNCSQLFNMFTLCTSLENFPAIQISNTNPNVRNILSFCNNLKNVDIILNNNIVDSFGIFNNCPSIQNVDFSQYKLVSLQSIAENATSLQTFQTNAEAIYGINLAIFNIPSLSSIRLPGIKFNVNVSSCKLSAAALNQLYTDLRDLNQTISLDGNTDVVTWNNHGYTQNPNRPSQVFFRNLTGITGLSNGATYWTRNVTENTFQISSSEIGGSIINFSGTGTANFATQTITVTGNPGTAGDDPTIATAKGWTVTGS